MNCIDIASPKLQVVFKNCPRYHKAKPQRLRRDKRRSDNFEIFRGKQNNVFLYHNQQLQFGRGRM